MASIPTGLRSIPVNPSIEFDRKRAKELLDAARQRDPAALARFQGIGETPALSDAQLVIAREYGFADWRELVEKFEQIEIERFKKAVKAKDVAETRRLLKASPDLREHVNDPLFDFGRRAVHLASGTPALMDVLLEFGADINLKSTWQKGPYSVMDDAPEEAAREMMRRGAKLTAHAAARFGWFDELRAVLDADPSVVHEKGGDGKRPLHDAKNVAVAELLLARGAEVDARCDDHRSTPAQYALGERPEVARLLLSRGALPDIFMAARLGDVDLARRLVEEEPLCVAARVNSAEYDRVPPFNIYCWVLGWYLSPHEVALKYGHREAYELLMSRSGPKVRLLVAAFSADEAAARKIVAEHPEIVGQLAPTGHALMAYAMFYGKVEAVKLMLSLGFDTMARATDGGTLLHMAAWRGNLEIVSLLLREYRDRVELDLEDSTHHSTPIRWAAHGSLYCRDPKGDYVGVVRALAAAGAKTPEKAGGTEEVQTALREMGAG